MWRIRDSELWLFPRWRESTGDSTYMRRYSGQLVIPALSLSLWSPLHPSPYLPLQGQRSRAALRTSKLWSFIHNLDIEFWMHLLHVYSYCVYFLHRCRIILDGTYIIITILFVEWDFDGGCVQLFLTRVIQAVPISPDCFIVKNSNHKKTLL